MMSISYRARAVMGAGILAAVPLAGCDVKDQLLQPQQPGLIQPADVAGVAGADALYLGALGRLKAWTVGGNVNQEAMYPMMSLMTDEFKSSDTFSQRNEADQRTVQTSNAQVQSVYTQAQQGRGYARDATQYVAGQRAERAGQDRRDVLRAWLRRDESWGRCTATGSRSAT